jgi:hypothetical protein
MRNIGKAMDAHHVVRDGVDYQQARAAGVAVMQS